MQQISIILLCCSFTDHLHVSFRRVARAGRVGKFCFRVQFRDGKCRHVVGGDSLSSRDASLLA